MLISLVTETKQGKWAGNGNPRITITGCIKIVCTKTNNKISTRSDRLTAREKDPDTRWKEGSMGPKSVGHSGGEERTLFLPGIEPRSFIPYSLTGRVT